MPAITEIGLSSRTSTEPAEWRRRLSTSDRGRAFKILECLKRHRAETAGADINVSLQGRPDDYIAMSFGPNIIRTPEQLETLATDLIGQVSPDGGAAEVSLVIAERSLLQRDGSCRSGKRTRRAAQR